MKQQVSGIRSEDPKQSLFYKFVSGEFKKPECVFEDDRVMVFKDINPVAPVHLLAISKNYQKGQIDLCESDQEEAELGYLMRIAGKVAKEQDLLDGYRLVVNQGSNALQSVNYLHIHILGCKGKKFTWSVA